MLTLVNCLVQCLAQQRDQDYIQEKEFLSNDEKGFQLRSLFELNKKTKQIVWSPEAITGFIVCLVIGAVLAFCCLYINFKPDNSPEAFVGKRIFH